MALLADGWTEAVDFLDEDVRLLLSEPLTRASAVAVNGVSAKSATWTAGGCSERFGRTRALLSLGWTDVRVLELLLFEELVSGPGRRASAFSVSAVGVSDGADGRLTRARALSSLGGTDARVFEDLL